jgi:thiamine-monophosphate kinase
VRENSLVRWLRDYQQSPAPHVTHGIGDDAAILGVSAKETVVTTDLICDGTHFISTECTAGQIGRKAMAVNLSDIAAMGAQPVAAFVSLLMPAGTDETFAQELMSAAISLANEFDCVVAGGDTNVWHGPLAVNVLVTGHVSPGRAIVRTGAKPGDTLIVTGDLGGSLAGHHFTFQPRTREAFQLNAEYALHAGMDLSDGLAMDLRRLCEASDCGAELVASQIPISNAARDSSKTNQEALQRALGDGEDFELLLALPPEEADRLLETQPLDVPVTAIGRCIEEKQLWLVEDVHGIPQRNLLPTLGYEHESKE